MILARNIRYLRRKNGWSLADLANRLGYKSFTTIHKWESGVNEPPLKTAHELARIFNVDIDDLVKVDLEYENNRPHDATPIEETPLFQRMMEETAEQPAVPDWYNELSEEDKVLVQLIMNLPADKKRMLTDLAESWKPPVSEGTREAGQQ